MQHDLSHLPTVLRRLLLRRTTCVIVCSNASCAIIGLLEVDSPSSTFCVFLSVFLTLYFLIYHHPEHFCQHTEHAFQMLILKLSKIQVGALTHSRTHAHTHTCTRTRTRSQSHIFILLRHMNEPFPPAILPFSSWCSLTPPSMKHMICR